MKKWLLALLAIVVVASAGAYYWYSQDDQTQAEAVQTPTAKVTRGSINVQITGSGSVNTTETISVYAGEEGTVSAVHFKQGDKVKKGQVLVEFEKVDYTSQIEKARINQKKQELQIENYKKQYIAAADDESKQNDIKVQMDSLRLDMESAQLELDELLDNAAETPSIVAPADGTVTSVSVVIGDKVSGSKVIAQLIDYTKLQFTMNVDELDIPKVKVGQTANITLNALPSQPLTGKVLEIAQEGSSSNGSASYAVKVSLDQLDNVISGMSGEGAIITATTENALLVPIEAVRTLGGKSFVRVPETSSAASQGAQGTQGAGTQSQGQGANGDFQPPADGSFQPPAGASDSAADGQVNSSQNAGSGQNAVNGRGSRGNRAAGGYGGERTGAAGAAGSSAGRTGSTGARGIQSQAGLEGRMVEVTIGISNDTYVEIKSGLNEGDTVYLPAPTVNTTTASSSQRQTQMFQFGGGGMPSGSFGGGNFGGGGGR